MENTQADIITAIKQICAEREISTDTVFAVLAEAIESAYKKEHGEEAKIDVNINQDSGEMNLFAVKKVVKDVKDSNLEISAEEAKELNDDVKVGDSVAIEIPLDTLGRIAARAAKQAIQQGIRLAEQEALLEYYADKTKEIVSGRVQRVRNKTVYVELDKGFARITPEEQTPGEFYEIGKRYRFIIKDLVNTDTDKYILLSRSDDEFIVNLLKMEIPEIANGIVEIKKMAREPGVRTKVAVDSNQSDIDPVGACIGQRGSRITAILDELGHEKLDVIPWDEDIEKLIANALSPAKVEAVKYKPRKKEAEVSVASDQLSLAIGKEGQNIRLASKLTETELVTKEVKSKEASQEEGEEEKVSKEQIAKGKEKEEKPSKKQKAKGKEEKDLRQAQVKKEKDKEKTSKK